MSTLEQALLALAFHIAPLHADDTDRRRAALQRDFKACFFLLRDTLGVACLNLRKAADSCLGRVEGSD
jgi:hypothetical protein